MKSKKAGFVDPITLIIISILALFFCMFILIYLFIGSPVQVKGKAMEPNYPEGSYHFVNKTVYRNKASQRGDVVIHNTSDDLAFIKRVIALPGDDVMLSSGEVYVNGEKLNEPYIASPGKTSAYSGGFIQPDITYDVPQDSIFVLGDNREFSSDSRAYGFVSLKSIMGKVAFCYWKCR